ncbi:uncharacterized protein LOC124199567 isoform X1 [Daphnia pulex]|uniref:uncharacterized protein LOC124199567 isoform X1 n=1 Tax=Daphnia pulex TaxID=6669 RepID=UPI001EE0722A|nr:uncharacterized protein LOC124199567 isoform X1 [Daphnia pulex]
MARSSFSFLFLSTLMLIHSVTSCGYPGSPSHAVVTFTPDNIRPGTVATYECEPGFELLGPSRRLCSTNGTWTPAGIPFCVLNVAAGKAPMQSSVAGGGVPERAVDGSTSNFFTPETCSLTEVERAPWWYVNLLEPYMVQLVRLDFGKPCCEDGKPATIVVRVGNSRPDMGVNAVCNRFTGFIEEGRPLFLPCNPPMAGAFVSVHLEGPAGNSLSICEAFVYTDQALPIERCPQFRDQEPGSSATYNGKCYLFHDNQPLNFNEARQFCEARGGSLIDETNPALQGFVSWELWRRHSRNDPSGQYWLGLMRDTTDRSNWKWLSGKDVSVSFWNLPGGGENCARYDGTKGWLWSDTNCNRKLFFICQHRPKSCGRPEQPANGTVIADNFNVGNRVEYRCDPGHMAVGPTFRTCLSSGFFGEYPPVCKYVQCGMPARIPNGGYLLVNDTRHYLSMTSYSCNDGYQLIGRGDLVCDIDGRWNGPPPRCEPVYCLEPPIINNGGFRLSTNSTVAGTVVEYYCLSNSRYRMSGPSRIVCQSDGHYDRDPPVCIDGGDEDARQPEKNVVPVDRKIDQPLQSHETEYVDDYEYYDETSQEGFIPPNFANKFNPTTKISTTLAPTTTSVRPVKTSSSTVFSTTSTTTPAPSTRSTSYATARATKATKVESTVRSTTTVRSRSTTPISMPTVPTRRPFDPTRLTKLNNRPTGTSNSRAGVFNNDNNRVKPDVALNVPNGPVYLSPQDNEIADSSNVKNNVPPNVNEPQNTVESESQGFTPKLNLGGIIALGVFGGFVFLSAIITTFVIVLRRIRNDKRYRRRGASSETQTAATFDSSSVDGGAGGTGGAGLSKSYRQAWDNLRDPEQPKRSKSHHHHAQASRKETLDDPNYRTRHTEVVREEGEMVVSDVYPKSGGKHHHGEKKRHHHHHHHKHSKRNASGDW